METIFTSLVTLWNAPKDWSLGAGPIWLTVGIGAIVVVIAVGIIADARMAR